MLHAACVAPVTRAILGNMHWRNTRELHVVCVAGFPVRRLYSHRITPTVISAAYLRLDEYTAALLGRRLALHELMSSRRGG